MLCIMHQLSETCTGHWHHQIRGNICGLDCGQDSGVDACYGVASGSPGANWAATACPFTLHIDAGDG